MKTVLSLLLITLFSPSLFAEDLKVYAAAAFKSPLSEIAAQYEKETGHKVAVIFDTAGATAQKFTSDPQAVLLITSPAVITDAEKIGKLKDGTTYRLGDSLAGIAYPPGSAKPDVSTPEKLKAALLGAKRIAFSDPARGATVGIHFMKVIDSRSPKTASRPCVWCLKKSLISALRRLAKFFRPAATPSRGRSRRNSSWRRLTRFGIGTTSLRQQKPSSRS